MTSADEDYPRTIVRSREDWSNARRRRQSFTFAGVFGVVMLIGLVAFGNWQQWWTIGGQSAAAVQICPQQVFVEPQLTQVNVINGTSRAGLAAAVAKELQKRRFRVLSIDTAQPDKPIRAVVLVVHGEAGTKAARTVAAQFPAKVVLSKDDREGDTVDVVLGTKYRKMMSAAKGTAAIRLREEPRGCQQPPAPSVARASETASETAGAGASGS